MFDLDPKFFEVSKHYHLPLFLLTLHSLLKVRNRRQERLNYEEVPGDNFPQVFNNYLDQNLK